VAVIIDAQNTSLLLIRCRYKQLAREKRPASSDSTLDRKNSQAVPIALRDMNAKLYNYDRSSSLRYPADAMYRQFVAESQLSPIDAKNGEIQELNPLRHTSRPWLTQVKT